MAVKLRLRRMGKKKQPFYRIVAIDSRAARNGRYLENLGTYNPLLNPAEINVKEDRALYWLQQGAIPTYTVKSFLRKKGILLKRHLMKIGADEATIEEELKKWEVLQLQKQKRNEALTEQKKRESKKISPELATVSEGEVESEIETLEVAEDKSKEVQEAKVTEGAAVEVKDEKAAEKQDVTDRESEGEVKIEVEASESSKDQTDEVLDAEVVQEAVEEVKDEKTEKKQDTKSKASKEEDKSEVVAAEVVTDEQEVTQKAKVEDEVKEEINDTPTEEKKATKKEKDKK